jgi:hypothetical protein
MVLNTAAIVHLLRPFVRRAVIANPLPVRAIVHAKITTDKIDAVVPAKLHASGFLPELWRPDEQTARNMPAAASSCPYLLTGNMRD